MKTYNAYVKLGRGRSAKLLWVQGARWAGDSIVVDLGGEPSPLPEKLASGACCLALTALRRRSLYVSTGFTLVEDEEVSSDD